jgi:hypothetical protein
MKTIRKVTMVVEVLITSCQDVVKAEQRSRQRPYDNDRQGDEEGGLPIAIEADAAP